MPAKISLWLMPAATDRAFFQDLIDRLAKQYDAPPFTPHVTLYSGTFSSAAAIATVLETTTQNIQPFRLTVDRLLYSDQFTKTLFVQFHPNPVLSQLSDRFRQHALPPHDYTLNPHLSLIYHPLSDDQKQQLVNELSLPQSEIWFDAVSAIATGEQTQTKQDVEYWQEIVTVPLQAV